MRRGEIWTAAGGGPYGREPRPVVVLQDDRFDETDSVTVCLVTSHPLDLPLLRVTIPPGRRHRALGREPRHDRQDHDNPAAALRERIGRLSSTDMVRVERAVVVFLGLAG